MARDNTVTVRRAERALGWIRQAGPTLRTVRALLKAGPLNTEQAALLALDLQVVEFALDDSLVLVARVHRAAKKARAARGTPSISRG